MFAPFSSPQYRKRTATSATGDECCICGKQTAGLNGAVHVPVNHETGEFVTEQQAAELGDRVSYFPVGPECAKMWSREFAGTTSVRFRRARDGVIAFDEKTERV